MIKNCKILITGGAGFIGSNLANKLIKNNRVTIVDDLSMGNRKNLPKSTDLLFYEESITHYDFMKKLLLESQFDYIFLLAAVASVADTIKRPIYTHIVNQDANLKILEIIRINDLTPKKIIFSSSAAVYGNKGNLPKNENSYIDPLTPYAIDKYATERFVIDYGKLYNLNTVATRFFNVYGPKQNPCSPYSGVLSLIRDRIKLNRSFILYGDGRQTRDFVYIDDVVQALLIIAVDESIKLSVFNVATGKRTSLNDVIMKFEKISGKKLHILYRAPRPGDIKNSVADISKISEKGYCPKFDLEVGLSKYWSANENE